MIGEVGTIERQRNILVWAVLVDDSAEPLDAASRAVRYRRVTCIFSERTVILDESWRFLVDKAVEALPASARSMAASNRLETDCPGNPSFFGFRSSAIAFSRKPNLLSSVLMAPIEGRVDGNQRRRKIPAHAELLFFRCRFGDANTPGLHFAQRAPSKGRCVLALACVNEHHSALFQNHSGTLQRSFARGSDSP